MAISKSKRKNTYIRDNYKCCRCGTTENLTTDHIVPKSIGGKDYLINLQTMCKECNELKGMDIKVYNNRQKTIKYIERFKA